MTAVTIPGLDQVPTTHERLLSWVREVAELTTPEEVVWVDGSDEEWDRLTSKLVDAGTFKRLDEEAELLLGRVGPRRRRARRGAHLHLLASTRPTAGATNNWMHPGEMKAIMTELYRGSMRGRTMYVDPVLHGSARRRVSRCSASRSPTPSTSWCR